MIEDFGRSKQLGVGNGVSERISHFHSFYPGCKTLSELIKHIKFPQRTGGVTQVVQHQLCKHKALSSNPSPTKNQNTTKSSIENLQLLCCEERAPNLRATSP
jgi:hypothetical protein